MSIKLWVSAFVMLACGIVRAAPVAVDFSVLGSNVVEITTALNPPGYTISNVTFRYDDLGSGIDFAAVDAQGVFGTTGGRLLLNFHTPVTAVNLGFSVLDVMGPLGNGVSASYLRNGTVVSNHTFAANAFVPYEPQEPSDGGDAFGSVTCNGLMFDQVALSFSTIGTYFTVDSLASDFQAPQMTIVSTPLSQFFAEVTVTGAAGSLTNILRATDLSAMNWSTVAVVTNFTGSYTFYETNNPAGLPMAYYGTR